MAVLILKKIFKHCLTTFMVLGLAVGGLAVVGVSAASASSTQRASYDSNNLVCGGVSTRQLLLKYANGGTDPCGHKDIGAIWARAGFTLQVAKSARYQKSFCNTGANSDLITTGRKHSPVPADDTAFRVNYKVGNTAKSTVAFHRNWRNAWGAECGPAWVAHTEDGHLVAILVNCGNTASTYFPPAPSPGQPPVVVACVLNGTPERTVPVGYTVQNGNCISIAAQACVVNYGGQWNSVTGICSVTQGNCDTLIVINGSGNVVNVTYNNSCDTTTTPPPTTTTTTPPPPPVVTPPQPPTIYGLTLPENGQISIDGSSPVCAYVNAPAGDSLSVTFTSTTIGDFSTPTQTVTSSGTTTVCATYLAPTNPVDYGSDTYTVSVYDSTTKLSALQTSTSFTINPLPSRPS